MKFSINDAAPGSRGSAVASIALALLAAAAPLSCEKKTENLEDVSADRSGMGAPLADAGPSTGGAGGGTTALTGGAGGTGGTDSGGPSATVTSSAGSSVGGSAGVDGGVSGGASGRGALTGRGGEGANPGAVGMNPGANPGHIGKTGSAGSKSGTGR